MNSEPADRAFPYEGIRTSRDRNRGDHSAPGETSYHRRRKSDQRHQPDQSRGRNDSDS